MSCVFSDCQKFLADVDQCNLQQEALAIAKCLCSDTVIASYSQCQPCLYSNGQTQLMDGNAYAAACRNGGGGLTGYPTGYPTYPTGGYPSSRPSSSGDYSSGGKNNGNNSNNSDSGSKTGMYIGIGCGVAALVILVIAFFVVRSRRKAKKNSKSDVAGANPSHPPPPMQPVQQNQFVQGQPPVQQFQPQPQPQVQQFQSQPQAQYVYPDQQQQYQPVYPQPPDQQYQVQHQQPVYVQPQDQQYQAQAQAQAQPGFVQPPGGYYDPNQQQAFYPAVASPPVATQPTPSPKFSAADQYHGQQQQYLGTPVSQEGIASTGNYHGYSPVTPSLTTGTTVYDPSQSPAVATAGPGAAKPTVAPHGPQAYIQENVKPPSAPANPQYVEGGYH